MYRLCKFGLLHGTKIINCERVAKLLRRLTCKPKFRTAVGSNPTLDSLVAVRNTSLGRPEPCEGNLVAVAGSCGGMMVKHPWPLLEISLSDFRGLATLNINTYLPTYLRIDLQCKFYTRLQCIFSLISLRCLMQTLSGHWFQRN